MSKIGWVVLAVLTVIVLVYGSYNEHRTTRREAAQEIKEAAQATGDYVKDTAREIKNDLQH